jgi:hypothetical protein
LAMARRADPQSYLCLGRIRQRSAMRVRCKEEPDFHVSVKISWAPDGKSLFAVGTQDDGTFGLIRWTTQRPFSPNPDDWSAGEFVTDTSNPGRGVLDAARPVLCATPGRDGGRHCGPGLSRCPVGRRVDAASLRPAV